MSSVTSNAIVYPVTLNYKYMKNTRLEKRRALIKLLCCTPYSYVIPTLVMIAPVELWEAQDGGVRRDVE